MTELKPCPFCGGEAELHDVYSIKLYWCKCEECGAETQAEDIIEKAIENWNRRVNNGKQ